MHVEQCSTLDHEAAHLFRVLFCEEAPQIIKARYCDAHVYMFNDAPQQELQTIGQVVEHRLDAEAVEVFLRRKGRPHLLTMKMQLLIYLAELYPDYYCMFVNEADSRWLAAWIIMHSLIRWPYAFIKGAYLTWRYQLV